MTNAASRPRIVTTLLLWLAALALGAAVISRSHFTADLSAFLPAAPDAQQRMLIEQLHSGTPARTLMLAIEGGTPEQRAAASRALAEQLRKSSQFDQVLNGDRSAFAALGEWVFAHRYLLSPNVDAKRFTAAGLAEAIDDTLSLLGTPAGSAIKPLLHRDPTGETQRIAEQSLGQGGPATFDGLWVSRDRQRALLLTTSKAAGADLDAQAATIATVKQAFAQLGTAGLRLQYTGAPKFAVDSRSQIQAEVEFLAIAGTLLMGGVLLLAFGSVVALAVAMLPVLTGVVAGVAAVSLGFGTVHGITLGFGTTLIGEAVDYAIYYLIQVRGGQGDPSAAQAGGWRRWLLDGWPTVRLGLLTSVCGFAALAFSAFPGLAQLGVFSIAGLVAAALTTRFVLPMLMPDGARGRGMRRLLGQWAMRLVAVLPRWRPLLSALGLASAGLLLWHHNHLWRAELSSLSPVPSAALALDASLRAELSQNDGGSLVAVQADSAQAVLQATEVIGQRLDGLVAQGRIGGFESVTRLLPSLATQKARQAALPEAEALQVALAQATKEGPLPAAKLAPFVADVQAARALPLVTPEAIANTPLGPLVANLLMRRADGQWLALMPLQAAGNTLDEAAVKGALRGLNGAQWLDISGELGRLYRRYLGEAQSQALLGVAGVVLLMALWLRSGRRLLAVCQPLLVSVLLTMAGLTLLQVPLGILHMVGLLLVVAVGSNYALFFDLLSQGDQANEDTMASLLLANLTTVLSFGLIAFSAIPSLSAIGRVVAPGAALALLLSAAYAPRRSSAQA